MKLYERIRHRREELGMSQDELAKKLGYKSRSTIAKIEKGENDITQSKISAFAKALNTTPSYLMGWDSDAPTNDGYYTDPEVAELAEELRTNPEKRILFDASKDLSKDDIDIVLNLIHGLKAKEGKNEE